MAGTPALARAMSLCRVTVDDVRAELIKLGHDGESVSDRTIARYLSRRRRARGDDATEDSKKSLADDFDARDDDDDDDDDVDWDAKDRGRGRRSEEVCRRFCSSTARPPWDGDAFQVAPSAPTSSARIDALPRRDGGGVAKNAAVEGRASSGRIDVVAVNGMFRKQWAASPAVVRGVKQRLVGFAQYFRAQHERERRKRETLLQGRRRYQA